ncbi:MAG: AAA family ATPase [Candidatus Binataceae bacterium]
MAGISRLEFAADTAPVAPGLFASLDLYGLDRLAPVLLAALATEEPLILIGAHGTGKTLLLTRVAEALGLAFRHYNASLLNFDDLVGFPLPGKDGSLEYVRTPAAIWGAEAVLFDEISRCRPDIQNKIFPVVHERCVQGLALTGLRYRWAAMNPPMIDGDDAGYIGSEPLDPALADRFVFVVQMPDWEQMSEAEQRAIIGSDAGTVSDESARRLRTVLATIHTLLPALTASLKSGLVAYLQVLYRLLGQAGIHLSPRRAGMLCRSTIAVHAAALVLDANAILSDSALLTVRHGLPHRAEGRKIAETALLAAHKEAWRLAEVKADDPLKAILMTTDPIDRVRIAIATHQLRKTDFSGIVADALVQLPPGASAALVVHLFETGAAGRLTAAVAEQAAELYRDIASPLQFSLSLYASHPRYAAWQRLKNILSRLDPDNPRAHLCANALVALYAREKLPTAEATEEALQEFRRADARLAGTGDS